MQIPRLSLALSNLHVLLDFIFLLPQTIVSLALRVLSIPPVALLCAILVRPDTSLLQGPVDVLTVWQERSQMLERANVSLARLGILLAVPRLWSAKSVRLERIKT